MPLRVAGIFAFMGAVWIGVTEWLVPTFVSNTEIEPARILSNAIVTMVFSGAVYLAVRLRSASRPRGDPRPRSGHEPISDTSPLLRGLTLARLGLWRWNFVTESLAWSDEMFAIFDIDRESFHGALGDWRLAPIHPADRERAEAEIFRSIDERVSQRIEYRVVRNGQIHNLVSESELEHDEFGSVISIFGTLHDITELKTLEHQYQQAQKMDAVGRLAGGVAHDFNNLITAISGNVDLALMSLDAKDPNRIFMNEIKATADRASNLTRQLLAFSRKQVIAPRNIDLNEVLGNMELMLRRLISENIELVFDQTEELGRVFADPAQIELVLVNLVINARDAMPSGGRLEIRTENANLDTEGAAAAVEPRVRIIVRDTGMGMSDDVLEHIFEPFFTTKEPGKGTGLGLATAYGVVKQNGGTISVSTESGKGTSVTISFPRVPGELVSQGETTAIRREIWGSERILVIDDEAPVRDMIVRSLRVFGFDVVAAEDAWEAIELCRNTDLPFDLLVSDVIMPDMEGPELARHIFEILPKMRILYMSGHTEEAIAESGVLEPGVELIAKPFRPLELAARVREVLDRQSESDVGKDASSTRPTRIVRDPVNGRTTRPSRPRDEGGGYDPPLH